MLPHSVLNLGAQKKNRFAGCNAGKFQVSAQNNNCIETK